MEFSATPPFSFRYSCGGIICSLFDLFFFWGTGRAGRVRASDKPHSHFPFLKTFALLQIPKAVLPLGNIPMVEYALRMLEREGFADVIVVAQETVSKALLQLMDEQNDTVRNMQPMRIKLDITTIPNESDLGTADVLRLIREKIHVRSCQSPLHIVFAL